MEFLKVEDDDGVAGESLEDYPVFAAFGECGMCEVGMVAPCLLCDPLDGVFVGAVVGVGDKVVGVEVLMDKARDGGWIPVAVVLELPLG